MLGRCFCLIWLNHSGKVGCVAVIIETKTHSGLDITHNEALQTIYCTEEIWTVQHSTRRNILCMYNFRQLPFLL